MVEALTPEQAKIVEQIFLDPATYNTSWPFYPFYTLWRTNNFIQRSMAHLFALDTTQTPARWIPLEVDEYGRLEVASIAGAITNNVRFFDGTTWQDASGDGNGRLNVNIVNPLPAGTNVIGNIETVGQANLYAYDGTSWQNLRVDSTAYPNLRVAVCSSGNLAFVTGTGNDGLSTTYNGLVTHARLYGFNGTSWDRLRSSIGYGLAVDVTRLPDAQKARGSTFAPSAVSVGATATLLKDANSSRKELWIANNSSVTVYIGDSSVTTTSGIPVAAGATYIIDSTTAAVYGIVESGTADCRVVEI
jgi:hypothetical protein